MLISRPRFGNQQRTLNHSQVSSNGRKSKSASSKFPATTESDFPRSSQMKIPPKSASSTEVTIIKRIKFVDHSVSVALPQDDWLVSLESANWITVILIGV